MIAEFLLAVFSLTMDPDRLTGRLKVKFRKSVKFEIESKWTIRTVVIVRTIQWRWFWSICYNVKFIQIGIRWSLCPDRWWSCLFSMTNFSIPQSIRFDSPIFTPIVGAQGSAGAGFCSKTFVFEFNCHGSPNGCDLLSHGSTAAGCGFDSHGSTGCTFMLPFVADAPFCSQASFDAVVDWLRDSQPSTLDTGFDVVSAHGSIGGEAVLAHGSTFC